MPEIDDGGPCENLTIRDTFAGLALEGIIAADHDCSIQRLHWSSIQEIARLSYRIADAMILARKLQPQVKP